MEFTKTTPRDIDPISIPPLCNPPTPEEHINSDEVFKHFKALAVLASEVKIDKWPTKSRTVNTARSGCRSVTTVKLAVNSTENTRKFWVYFRDNKATIASRGGTVCQRNSGSLPLWTANAWVKSTSSDVNEAISTDD